MEKDNSKRELALKITPFVSTVAAIAYIICVFVAGDKNRIWISNILFIVPIVVASFVLVKSYLDHNKNVMKSLIGFILAGLLMLSMHYAFTNFDGSQWDCIAKAVIFGFVVIFTVNQFLLSNDHYARPLILFINQAIVDIIVILGLTCAIIDAVQFKDNIGIFISLLLFAICSMFLVLELEIKVNDYKLVREEKGYVFKKTQTSEDVLEEEDKFISNSAFISLPGLVLLALILCIIFNAIFDKVITWGYSTRYLFFLVKFVGLLVAILAYKKHHKNVMKVMLGFLLGVLLFENIYELTFISSTSITALKSIFTMIMVPVNILFLICHLLLTRTHSSNPSIVKLMKIVYLVYAIATLGVAIGWQVYYLIAKGNNYYFFVLKPIIWMLGTFPVITGILTIDTRINGFKLKREQR